MGSETEISYKLPGDADAADSEARLSSTRRLEHKAKFTHSEMHAVFLYRKQDSLRK